MNVCEQRLWKENLRKWSLGLGFASVGFSSADPVEGLAALLRERFRQDLGVPWENKEVSLRSDPRAVWPDCRTVVVLAYPFPYSSPPRIGEGVLARSAVGEDYHLLLRQKIISLTEIMKTQGWTGLFRWQADNGSLNERAFARKAGLGWIGRNQQLIMKGWGSFAALCLLLLDEEIEPDEPFLEEGCGTCRNCLEACPAQILGGDFFAAKDCVSYLTQSKAILSTEERQRLGLRLFGCDRCQEVCPHNFERVEAEEIGSFPLNRGVDIKFLLNIDKKSFNERFASTAAGWRGKNLLRRNAFFAACNSQDEGVKLWLAEQQDKQTVPAAIKPYLPG